ncbi:NYN domain-containing protein [Amycolatopsis sp. cmx-11-32]|uniref:NYN domain-containing protein n=1 Tax=Amycolatopsis sp. cmx-11-32 TaxID=2785796 RepID=UPI0039E27093
MRSHCAVYVDVGYLLAAAATRATGTSLRSSVIVDYQSLIEILAARASAESGLPLLRIYWYDSAANGVPNTTQESIGLLRRVKLRLGRLGVGGEQKGVDLRIGLDLATHARNAAVDSMYLVSGDDDLTEAVDEAQAHGVQVTILAVPTREGRPHGVSRHLQGAADGLDLLDGDALDAAVRARAVVSSPQKIVGRKSAVTVPSPSVLASGSRVPGPTDTPLPLASSIKASVPPSSVVYTSTTGSEPVVAPQYSAVSDHDPAIDRVVGKILSTWLDAAPASRRTELSLSRPSIPSEVDRALLTDLSDDLGVYDLSPEIRYRLRERFWQKVDESNTLTRDTP